MNSLDFVSKELKKIKGKKVVLTGGCFDLLHIGHVRLLNKAKTQGDILVIGIDNDQCIRERKGENRPVIPAEQRMELLLGFKSVDYVFITHDLYADENLKKIKPDILVLGKEKGKIRRRKITANKIEKKYPGIKVIFLSSGVSEICSTNIENRILRNYRGFSKDKVL
jgi:rfaE bifunctional protein nucleotidyltransferase chain/domain